MWIPHTPLRYPGGKAKLGPFLAGVIGTNELSGCAYAEPYAGGAGAGLYLLFNGHAKRFFLNDIDRGVISFWRAVLNDNERFVRRIKRVPLSVAEWDRQKDAYRSEPMGFDLGFAFFYLNRTNRSGIMNGGMIGGREQLGRWTIEARFNRDELAARVRALKQFRHSISVSRADALDFLANVESRVGDLQLLTYLDPPYFAKGRALYTNYYDAGDHVAIAARLRALSTRWVLTYDDCQDIRHLYRRRRFYESAVEYTAREVSRGRELVILGPHLRLPKPERPRSRIRHTPSFQLLERGAN